MPGHVPSAVCRFLLIHLRPVITARRNKLLTAARDIPIKPPSAISCAKPRDCSIGFRRAASFPPMPKLPLVVRPLRVAQPALMFCTLLPPASVVLRRLSPTCHFGNNRGIRQCASPSITHFCKPPPPPLAFALATLRPLRTHKNRRFESDGTIARFGTTDSGRRFDTRRRRGGGWNVAGGG